MRQRSVRHLVGEEGLGHIGIGQVVVLDLEVHQGMVVVPKQRILVSAIATCEVKTRMTNIACAGVLRLLVRLLLRVC